jgi:Sigma-70, region 4
MVGVIFQSYFKGSECILTEEYEPNGNMWRYCQIMANGDKAYMTYHRRLSLVDALDALAHQEKNRLGELKAAQVEEQWRINHEAFLLRNAQELKEAELATLQMAEHERIRKEKWLADKPERDRKAKIKRARDQANKLIIKNEFHDWLDSIKDELQSEGHALEFNYNAAGLLFREFKVLSCRSQKITLKEIGNLIGVTTERVRQMEAGAWRKLRRPGRTNHLKLFALTHPDYFLKANDWTVGWNNLGKEPNLFPLRKLDLSAVAECA